MAGNELRERKEQWNDNSVRQVSAGHVQEKGRAA